MATVADVAHSIADDIERLGFGHMGDGLNGTSGPCCLLLNPTVDGLSTEERGRLFRILIKDHFPLGISHWNDRHTKEQAVEKLRSINDRTEI